MCFDRIPGLLIAILTLAVNSTHALEIESEYYFPATTGDLEIRMLSTADLEIFAPIVTRFQAENPEIAVRYTVASSREIFEAVYTNSAQFDLVVSSAMDLQTKLVNDGRAQAYRSSYVDNLPDWAGWRNEIFAFTTEPAVLLLSKTAMKGLSIPQDRSELMRLLRDNPKRFRGKIGTYDIRTSGLGYLFATQDSRSSDSYWRLVELMGQLGTRLYCCSANMIKGIKSGELAIAYNVLGSYSKAQIDQLEQDVEIVSLTDYSTVMLRTVLIPLTSQNAEVSGKMIDFLVNLAAHPDILDATGFLPIIEPRLEGNESIDAIRLGPNLLVFLDELKKGRFIDAWERSMEQH